MSTWQEQYVIDKEGKRIAVLLAIKDYERLLEDLHDLAIVAERREPYMYRATLRGNRLEWVEGTPDHLTPGRKIAVYVTILDEPNAAQGQRMAAALEQLAAARALAGIAEPAAWEREVRQDRTLPDREG